MSGMSMPYVVGAFLQRRKIAALTIKYEHLRNTTASDKVL